MDQKKFEELLKNKDFVKEMLSKKDFNTAKEFFKKNKLTINDEEIKKFCRILLEVVNKINSSELSYKDLKGINAGVNKSYIDQVVNCMLNNMLDNNKYGDNYE